MIFPIPHLRMGWEIFGITLDFHARIDGWLDYLLHGDYLWKKEIQVGFQLYNKMIY